MIKRFRVPQEKSSEFYLEFFTLMSNSMQDLVIEYNKWPDEIIFFGHLGIELNDIIISKGWDFSKFKISTNRNSPINKILFKYTKPFTVSNFENSDGSVPYLRGDDLDNRTISGIPGSETMNKIISNSISKGFNIERTVRPESEVILFR